MYEQIIERLRHSPFEPFIVKTSDGEAYTIHHPENAAAGKRTLVIMHSDERVTRIAMLHVTAVEDANPQQA